MRPWPVPPWRVAPAYVRALTPAGTAHPRCLRARCVAADERVVRRDGPHTSRAVPGLCVVAHPRDGTLRDSPEMLRGLATLKVCLVVYGESSDGPPPAARELWPPARPTLETMHVLQALQPASQPRACERTYGPLTQRSRHSRSRSTACSRRDMASRPRRGRASCTSSRAHTRRCPRTARTPCATGSRTRRRSCASSASTSAPRRRLHSGAHGSRVSLARSWRRPKRPRLTPSSRPCSGRARIPSTRRSRSASWTAHRAPRSKYPCSCTRRRRSSAPWPRGAWRAATARRGSASSRRGTRSTRPGRWRARAAT